MGSLLQVAVPDDEAGDETRSLRAWLSGDPDLSELEISATGPPVQPGDMGGGGWDLLRLVLEPDGFAIAAVTAVVTWLSTRRRTLRIRLRAGEREVEIDASGSRDVEKTVRMVLEHLRIEPEDR